MKRVEITVLPSGQTRVETKGFAGAECRRASQFVEEALGATAEEELTQEYFRFEAAKQSQQQRQ